MLLVLLEGCNIHVIPLRLACVKCSTYVPIEWQSIHTWRYVAHAHGSGQVLVSDKADIYPLAIHCLEHITLHEFHNALMCIDHKVLCHNALHRASECYLNCQISSSIGIVGHMELSVEITLSNQLSATYLVHMFTSSQVHFLVKYQLWRACAVKISKLIWIYYNHFFLYTQGQWLIGGQLHKHIILVQDIQEHASELVLLLCTSSNHPVFLDDSTGRTVQTHVKCHVCCANTIVSNHKLELFVCHLHLYEVKAIPLFTSRHGNTSPIEVFRF